MPELHELAVERFIDATPAVVWRVMTERMAAWWCPAPWSVEIVEQDWRAGGRSAMVMHGPNGEAMPQEGVFLEVVPGVRFVFTDAFAAGWIPQGPFMVGTLAIAPEGKGTGQGHALPRHRTPLDGGGGSAARGDGFRGRLGQGRRAACRIVRSAGLAFHPDRRRDPHGRGAEVDDRAPTA